MDVHCDYHDYDAGDNRDWSSFSTSIYDDDGTDGYSLYDAAIGTVLAPSDLGLSDAGYRLAICDSQDTSGAGHVLVAGVMAYAQKETQR